MRGGDATGLRLIDHNVRLAEVDGIGEVEDLGAKLQTFPGRNPKLSRDQKVEVGEPGRAEHVPPAVAIRELRWNAECRDVVPPVDGSLAPRKVRVTEAIGPSRGGGIRRI